MGKRKKGSGPVEWEFDNPVATTSPTPRSPQDGASPRGVLRTSAFDADLSPRTPATPPDSLLQGVDLEADMYQNERGYRRKRYIYTVFMAMIVPLIPGYGLFALLMGWAWWVVPNAISAVAMVVTAVLPWVLWLGLKGARRASMARLQLFSFMMLLAISLQLSLAFVMILDDGTLSDAYVSGVTVAFSSLCEESAALPVGANKLPIGAVCDCLAHGGSGSVAASVASVALPASNLDVIQCARAVLERDLGFEGTDIVKLAVATLLIEAGLAWLAYHMMEDLDATAAQAEAAQKGGRLMGTLRGEIVRGSKLGSAAGLPPKKKRKFLGRKKEQNNGGGLASRYAVLTVRTKDLFDPSREVQKRTTNIVEDDADPAWNFTFGFPDSEPGRDGIDIFEESQPIEIWVFDGEHVSATAKLDKKARAPVCVGKAGEHSSGTNGAQITNGVHFIEDPATRAGMIPELDYATDGKAEVEIPLFLENKKGSLIERAGSVTVRFQYTPRPPLLSRSAATVTQSWYYEATVLGMCLLAMIALGLRAPADPPSPTLFAALRISELFVATHMVVELLLEVQGTIASGEKFLTETWFLLAVFILACNWISILFPQESDGSVQTAPAQHAATDVLSPGHLTGALANQKIRKLISVGRVFRVVRPIRTLRLIPHVDMIVSTLQDSMGIFGTVCMLIVFLLAVFALIGISSFGGALQYECIDADENGNYVCTEGQLRAAEDSNVGARGSVECPIRCPLTLACAQTHMWCAPLEEARVVGVDPFGYRNFDNFGVGILSVFIQMSGTGGLHTLPFSLEEAGAAATTRGFFISCLMTLLLNLVALNLFLAVCCSAYSDVACKEMELEQQIDKLKEQQKEDAIANETFEQKVAREQAEALEIEESKSYGVKLAEKDWSHSRMACFRNVAKRVVLSDSFETLTSYVIIGNTVTMAMAHEGMPEEWRYWLAGFETLFLVAYVAEALIKVVASGRHLYFASLSNRFDCFVICCSFIGFFATFFSQELQAVAGNSVDSVGSLQVLRAVRLLRALQVVRLLHRQKALILVMRTIFKAWRPLFYHSIFCVFSMSIFAIIGMHMFGGSLGPGVTVAVYEDIIPEHFETFLNGLLTCFEMTVGEDWSASMWYYMKMGSVAYGYPAAIVAVFFMLMYIWMSCILFSLYVAMLLQNFATLEEERMGLQIKVYNAKALRAEQATARARKKLQNSLLEQTVKDDKSKGHAFGKKTTKHVLHQAAATCEDMELANNKSLYLFRLDSHVRILAATMQDHPMFKRIVMILILFSSVSLAVEGRGEGVAGAPQILGFSLFSILNLLVLGAFIFEAGLKIVIHGFGFKSGPTAPYLASRMNQLDFVVVVACLAAYMPFVPIEGPWARALRLGRVITPISNALAKHPDIALVILSFFRAAPQTTIVLLPLVLLALVFSIVGVAWFGGKDQACVDLTNSLDVLPYDRSECLNMTGHDWVSPAFNFDNSINGMASLFVATTDGTHSYMLKHNAITDGWTGTAFWVCYHLIFTCFFLNLFLGVLTAAFEQSSGVALRTNGEKTWLGLKRFLLTFHPENDDEDELRPRPSSYCCSCMAVPWFKFRTRMFELAIDKRLEKVWGAAIVANTCTLATDRFPIPVWQLEAVEFANKVFLLLCLIEVCTKLFGYGYKHFFSQGWYVSDFVLVSVSLFLRATGGQSGIEALRVVRVFRIVVLASKIPALVQLIDVLVRCLQASLAVIILTALAMYFYSIVGMNLYGHLPSDEMLGKMGFPESEWEELRSSSSFLSTVCPSCLQYSDTTNFLDFLSSARLLVQLVFGQSMAQYIRELHFLGGNFWLLLIFFASFYSLTVWVFMNLLIVTVLSNFDSASAGLGTGKKAIKLHDVEGFTHTWAALTIGVHQVPSMHNSSESLLERLKHTLELHEENEEHGVESAVYEDGPPELCGQLTITMKSVSGLDTDTARPFCAVTISGSDSKGTHTQVTETRKSRNGTATWKQNTEAGSGAVLQFHATGYHTDCKIDVIDSCQFGDKKLGSVFLNFGENLDTGNLRGGCTEPRSYVFDTAISSADLANRSDEPLIGDPDRWDRFAMDGEEDDDFEDAEDDPTDVMIECEEETQTLTDVEEAQQKVLEMKQRKDVKKLQKRLTKTSSKASSQGSTSTRSPDSPSSDHGVVSTCPQGWQETRVKVQVEILWEPKQSETPTLSFLADHRVHFAHKEGSCGAEGWLDISEENNAFKRRFCYVQTEPVPALKFYRTCQTQDDLERYGMRNKLNVATVRGTDLLSISRGLSNKRMARRSRKAANFEVEFDKVQNKSRRKTLVKIARISGTVLGAEGLKKPAVKGLQVMQLLKPMDSVGVPAPFEEELSEGEPATEHDTAPLDDPDQVPNTGPARYMTLKSTIIRQGSSLSTMQVAQIERYQVVTVTHTVEVEGMVRLRTRAGWVSLRNRNGWPIMVDECNQNRHYRVRREVAVDSHMNISECSTDANDAPVVVPKGSVVEVLESQEDLETDTMRHRIVGGWLSERDLKQDSSPEISCEVEIEAWEPSAEQRHAQPLLQETGTPQQVFRTVGLKDTLSPVWSEPFAMNVFASSIKLHIRVFDEASDTELGNAQLLIGSDGIPGPTLNECRDSSENKDGSDPSQNRTVLSDNSFTSLNVQLYKPVEENGDREEAAMSRAASGSVKLLLLYTEIFRRDEQLLPLARAAAVPGDLCTCAEMICNQTRQATWRFQAANPTIARQWCTILRWMANGCPSQQRPYRVDIDLPPVLPRELTRAMHDISLVDLPFNRATDLLHGLYHRRVMGSYKPTLRRCIYTVFQLETHAWGQGKMVGGNRAGYARALEGCYLRDMRGLHFHNVLERLALLHYGKRRCLPYEDQMEEYEREIQYVALHMVQCAVAGWVFRRRIGKTIGGHPWPWHSAWRTTHPATYLQATEAVCATRFRSLGILRREIIRYSKPDHMTVRVTQSATSNGTPLATDGDGTGGAEAVDSKQEVDLENARGTTTELSEEQRGHITALWGERGSLDVNSETLRGLLAQIFAEDEGSFIVNSVLLDQLGAVGGELSLSDLLEGMDRMVSQAVADADRDDNIGDLGDDCDSDVDDLIIAAERPPGLALRNFMGDV